MALTHTNRAERAASTHASAAILATGRDDAGRKQYVYHPRWTEVRDAVKFGSLVEFGHGLPALRHKVNSDL